MTHSTRTSTLSKKKTRPERESVQRKRKNFLKKSSSSKKSRLRSRYDLRTLRLLKHLKSLRRDARATKDSYLS
jgi:hypothetical protein